MHDYRKFVYVDPGLPSELLPPHWPGTMAAALFREFYAAVDAKSMRYLSGAGAEAERVNRAGHAQTRINSFWRHCAFTGRLRRFGVDRDSDDRPVGFAHAKSVDQNGERFRHAFRRTAVPSSRLDFDAEVIREPAAGNAVCGADHGARGQAIARLRDVQETQTRHDVLLGRHDRVSFADTDAVDHADHEPQSVVGRSRAVSDTVARYCYQLREQLAIRRRSARKLTPVPAAGVCRTWGHDARRNSDKPLGGLLFVFLEVEVAAVFCIRQNLARFTQYGLRKRTARRVD